LDGTQPEHCELISQFLPIEGGKSYAVRFRYRVPPVRSESTGLFWAVTDRSGNQIANAELVSSHDSQEGSFTCGLPQRETGARLSLVYRRPMGAARFRGEVRLEAVMADNE
jgi:hypothetical protein